MFPSTDFLARSFSIRELDIPDNGDEHVTCVRLFGTNLRGHERLTDSHDDGLLGQVSPVESQKVELAYFS